jgi:hypothetical protein
MYYEKDPNSRADLENERILGLISESPSDACESDPAVRAAFEESLRHLAEDIIEFNPGLAHILLGMGSGKDGVEIHGRN